MEAKKKLAEKAKGAEELCREASKRKEELDALLEIIWKSKKYNDFMNIEVLMTRTIANKTKEDLKAQAKSKLDQDIYNEILNMQVTQLED